MKDDFRNTHARIQNMFRKSVTGLAQQGFALSTREGSCSFRGDQGRACAVGHLLSSNAMRRVREVGIACTSGLISYQIPINGRVLKKGSREGYFLRDLQMAHDNGLSPAFMRSNLRVLARKYPLRLPPELKE